MASRSNRGEEKPAKSVATPAETVHSHSLSDESFTADAAPGSGTGQKICCACGKDVAHEERFKDKKGRYWCYQCGVADSQKRHHEDSLRCPDCGESFASKDLVEHEGHHLCRKCVDQRVKSAKQAKREAARKAAAVEAERASVRKRKQIIFASVAFALVAAGVAAWVIFR